MGRIRTLKPEILEDQKTASLSDAHWRLFVSLIVMADDYGNMRANPKQLDAAVFWARDDGHDMHLLLADLASSDRPLIQLYEIDGQPYAHLTGWKKHQKVDRPGPHRCPPPTAGGDHPREPLASDSRGPRESGEDGASGSESLEDLSAREPLASGSRQIRTPTPTSTQIRTTTTGAWSAREWFEKFQAAWVKRRNTLTYGGPASDLKAVRELDEDILPALAVTDRLAAQERAEVMFDEFLSDSSKAATEARHPWCWFVTRFNGLRVPRPTSTETASATKGRGHARNEEHARTWMDSGKVRGAG